MNFVDFIILILVLGALGSILYFDFFKKNNDECKKCPYKKKDCNCGKKK